MAARDQLRFNSVPPVDRQTGTAAPGDFLKIDSTTGKIVGAAGGGLTMAQVAMLVSYRG